MLATAFMITGCGDATQSPVAKNSGTSANAAPRSPDHEPVQDGLRSTPKDSGTRAVSQDRALADNADKQAAGVKQDYNGIAKPMVDNQSINRPDTTYNRPLTNVAMPDAVVRDASTSSPNLAQDKPRSVDNSGQNEIDKQGMSMTPLDQGNGEADIAVTQTIRKALTGDSTLSTNAQNLKVITRDGIVVLRGPAASQAEADAVVKHAKTAAGANRIDNQIAVPAP